MAKPPVQTTQYLNKIQVAALLAVSLDTIQRWKDTGKMPQPLKPGGKLLRWHRDTIQRWIDKGCPRCR